MRGSSVSGGEAASSIPSHKPLGGRDKVKLVKNQDIYRISIRPWRSQLLYDTKPGISIYIIPGVTAVYHTRRSQLLYDTKPGISIYIIPGVTAVYPTCAYMHMVSYDIFM